MASALRVVIAGGGTGGHLMPGLAVARKLRESGAEVVFVGTERGLEAKLVPEAGYGLELIRITGLKGRGWRQRLAALRQLPGAVKQSAAILRRARAQVVFGIGGYASGPVLAAAALLRIPSVVLEVNAKTGLANRLAAPFVRAAAVNFPETARDFRRAQRVEVTGIPVRAEFFAIAAAASEVDPAQVLVSGGSQGAHALNMAAVGAVLGPAGPYAIPVRWRHQTGAADYPMVAEAYARLDGRAQAEPFINDMAAAMAEAHVVICRAGASTLGELAAAGRAAILVPYPAAADQHQLRNAQAYARAGAAILLEQRELTPERLSAAVGELIGDEEQRQAMARAVRAFARPDAAERIAALVAGAVRAH